MYASLVIIDQFNIARVPFDKAKDHPPVRSNGDSIKPLPVAFQGMESEARYIHVAWCSRMVEHRKDIFDLFAEISPDTFILSILKQALEPFVPEVDDPR